MPSPPAVFRRQTAASLALFALLGSSAAALGLKPAKLNVLLISIDTLRADHVSCLGGQAVVTKAIDRLASRGVVFRRAFAHAPLTLPSHTSMLTGTIPPVHGIHDNLGFRVGEEGATLAGHLRAQGYRTAAFVGAFPLDSRFGLDRGFDLYDDLYGEKRLVSDFHFVERRGAEVVDRALAWILDRDEGRWFAFVHLFDPHQPYAPPPPFDRRFSADPYAGEVAYADDCLGRLFDLLQKAGRLDETLVVFTSDHGESLGEHGELTHGYFAYNSTLHVPLILHAPALFKTGQAVGTAVSHVDIFPTVCDLLGLKPPPGLQGRSLRPLIEGGSMPEAAIYFESLAPNLNRNWAPLRGVLLNGKKYIDLPLPELYDLTADFQERKNLLPGADASLFRKSLRDLEDRGRKTGPVTAGGEKREVEQAMRSLGYLASSGGPSQRTYTIQDDLKTLLPDHLKLMEAAALHTAGDSRGAIGILRGLLRARKDFSAAAEYLADILQQTGDKAGARAVLEQGVAANKTHDRLRGRLGILLSEMGDDRAAVREIEQALELNPDDAELWNYLGVARWKLGEWDGAEVCYRRALELDRDYAGALNNLGSLSLSRREPDKALDFFDRSLSFDPRLASAYNGRAVALGMKGDLEGAVASWKTALDREPEHLLALYNLGLGLIRLRREAEALPYLERYLLAAPADDGERDKVARLVAGIKKGG